MAYINRAENKYAVHVTEHGGAVKYCSTLASAYNYLQKHFNISKDQVEYIKR